MAELVDLSELSTPNLLQLSRSILDEPRRRGVLRTANAPAGDYAEYLVKAAYRGELAPNSEKGWDIRSSDGRKLQVKARVVGSGRGTQLFSPFRSFEDFDACVLVLLDQTDLSVRKAVEMPRDVVREHSAYRSHVNGCVARTTLVDLGDQLVLDVTDRLRLAGSAVLPFLEGGAEIGEVRPT